MSELIPRRGFLATSALAIVSGSSGVAGEDPAKTRTFHLKETAGLRRFGYPVHTILPPDLTGPNFRLEKEGKPIQAQFRKVEGQGDKVEFALDFIASPGPLDKETYTVRSGESIEAGPEPKGGMRVEHVEGSFVVSNGSALTFKVADPLGTFLQSVTNAKLEFIGKPLGFMIGDKRGERRPIGSPISGLRPEPPLKGVLTRQGPMAIGLRFEGATNVRDAPVTSVVEMTFPISKSWVEVLWTMHDPADGVGAIDVGTGLELEGVPVLVDLGASNTVYSPLREKEVLQLTAGSAPGLPPPDGPWEVSKGIGQTFSPFARAASKDSPPAEGWAHLMDKSRCTAFAVADFGRSSRDDIVCSSSGALILRRRFAKPGTASGKTAKTVRFWLHFVSMPVQVGAATSPQAMLAPLSVEWT
jgi:hypothetical protein